MGLSVSAKRARLLAFRDVILAHGDGAIWYLTGTIAPTPETVVALTPHAVLPLTADSFELHATAAEMLVTSEGNATAAGITTWVRFVDANGDGIRDMTAGVPGSGAQVIVTDGETPPSAQVWTGGEITFTHTLIGD